MADWGRTGKIILAAVVALALFLLVWGAAIEPYLLDVEPVTASVPDLPAEWEGQRIAVVGDFQIGMWLANVDTVRQAIAEIIERRPAAALLLGDLVYQAIDEEDTSEEAGDGNGDELEEGALTREQEIQIVQDLVRPLTEAGIPTYAVLGGHDYAVSTLTDGPEHPLAERVAAALEAVGVVVLRNEAVPLAPAEGGGAPLYLAGIGPFKPGVSHPEQALAQVPDGAPRIVIFHHPETFEQLPASAAPVAFAGHTHGGQIRVPFTPDWSPLDYFVEGDFHAAGWVEPGVGQAGNRLYINRGIGFSLVPLRINARPELTVVTLTGG